MDDFYPFRQIELVGGICDGHKIMRETPVKPYLFEGVDETDPAFGTDDCKAHVYHDRGDGVHYDFVGFMSRRELEAMVARMEEDEARERWDTD